MALDREVIALLEGMPAPSEAPANPSTPQQMRADFAAALEVPEHFEEVGSVEDLNIPGPVGDMRVRIYKPRGTSGPVPVFVWIHGGGWTIGTIEENEVSSRAVCNAAGVAVVAVEYRLAPEDPFPAAPEDCYAVVSWLAEHGAKHGIDSRRMAVGGESAGGNLSAVVSLMSRDLGGPRISAQVLICPVFGHPDDGRASYADFATGYGMGADAMHFFFEQYVSEPADTDNPYLLPLRAKDLTGLPPALVMTAEYDVLRDEGEDFAERLRSAGVPTILRRYEGQIHGFYGLYTQLSISRTSHLAVAGYLREIFEA